VVVNASEKATGESKSGERRSGGCVGLVGWGLTFVGVVLDWKFWYLVLPYFFLFLFSSSSSWALIGLKTLTIVYA
jgi:hypothetical protein